MSEIDPTLAPPGYRARAQTDRERSAYGYPSPSCEGCAFDSGLGPVVVGACRDRPCSWVERPDRQPVIFEKVP